MNNSKVITGSVLKQMVLAGSNKLNIEKSAIDNLNVFPVPDGDTGTNMSLTLNSAAKLVGKIDDETGTVADVAKQMAYGALMGARGNSGVILSQLLGGLAKVIGEEEVITSKILSAGFNSGVEAAYKAVMKPMEGTILTVAREASEKLTAELHDDMGIEEALTIFLEEGYRSLARTPEMLPVLKQAGVVDAGGKGILVVVEGMLAAYLGKADFEFVAEVPSEDKTPAFVDLHDGDIKFQYCTEFLITSVSGKSKDEMKLREYLESIGDSSLVVGMEGITKVHVHTNNPGQALEFALTMGDLLDIKIENMKAQNQAFEEKVMEEKDVAVIAVSSGEGLNEIFVSLGVDHIITGGQTMNPSTEDFLEAIEKVNAKHTILLPNNKNIILTAEQASKLVEKDVHVIGSRSIPQGVGALMAYSVGQPIEDNIAHMQDSLSHIKTGEITYAVRNTKFGDDDIKEGQILGIIEGKINVVGEEINEIVKKTVDAMGMDEFELVTLYFGKDITEDDADHLVDELGELYPEIDFELHNGAQPVYYYLISAE